MVEGKLPNGEKINVYQIGNFSGPEKIACVIGAAVAFAIPVAIGWFANDIFSGGEETENQTDTSESTEQSESAEEYHTEQPESAEQEEQMQYTEQAEQPA